MKSMISRMTAETFLFTTQFLIKHHKSIISRQNKLRNEKLDVTQTYFSTSAIMYYKGILGTWEIKC